MKVWILGSLTVGGEPLYYPNQASDPPPEHRRLFMEGRYCLSRSIDHAQLFKTQEAAAKVAHGPEYELLGLEWKLIEATYDTLQTVGGSKITPEPELEDGLDIRYLLNLGKEEN